MSFFVCLFIFPPELIKLILDNPRKKEKKKEAVVQALLCACSAKCDTTPPLGFYPYSNIL